MSNPLITLGHMQEICTENYDGSLESVRTIIRLVQPYGVGFTGVDADTANDAQLEDVRTSLQRKGLLK